MGRNAEIKQYDTHPAGQPMELFAEDLEPCVGPGAGASGGGTGGPRARRLPVLAELLCSPWIVRGSDLPAGAGGAGPHRVDEPVEVEWDAGARRPAAFTRVGGPRRTVDAVTQVWAVERHWWDPSQRVSRRCFRVQAHGGVYDLAYDRVASRWVLLGVAD